MHSCACIFSLAHLILQQPSLFNSTDLVLYKAEMHTQGWNLYLQQSQHGDSTLGPDISAVLGTTLALSKNFLPQDTLNMIVAIQGVNSVFYFLNRY